MEIDLEIYVREHYRALVEKGFLVMQGGDSVNEDDFYQIFLEHGRVDLIYNGKRYDNLIIYNFPGMSLLEDYGDRKDT